MSKNYGPSCLGTRFCWAEWSDPSCLWAGFSVIPREQQNITRDLNLFVALILDCTAVDLNLSEPQRADFLSKFEYVARGMCYALHCKKTITLNQQQ